MKKRILIVLAAFAILASSLGAARADDAALREEIRLLRERLDEVEAKQAAAAEEAPQAKDGSASLEKALEERFGSLSIHGTLVGYYQGSTSADIAGQSINGESNGGYIADLTLGWTPVEKGAVTVRLHAGEGDGADRLLVERNGALLADLNTLNDDNPGDQGVELLEAFYTQQLFDDVLTVSVGKTQPLNFIDQNAFANNEVAQFVGKPFVNDPVLDSENEYGPTLAIGVKPVEELEFTAVVASSTRPQAADTEQKSSFDNIADTPFLAAQVAYMPKLFGLDGAYRLYGWSATYKHAQLVDADNPDENLDQKRGWGVGLSLDQKITEKTGVFARLGFHDEDVYASPWTWAAGVSMDGLLPDRDADTLGVGVAGLSSSDDKLLGDVRLGGGMEYHLEAFYRIAVSEHFFLTPDLQYVVNPLGDDDNDGVFAGMLKAEFSF